MNMKKILLISLCLTNFSVYADVKIVPLDMELGYWETTAEMLESDAVTKMLATLPEAQRAQVQSMMKNKMKIPTVKQCIAADSFDNFEEKFKESMGGKNDCEFEIVKSTSQEFVGLLKCSGHETSIQTKVVDSKRQISNVVSSAGGAGESKIRTTAQWKSSVCPEGVTP